MSERIIQQAVTRVIVNNEPVSSVAREFGISHSTLYHRVQQAEVAAMDDADKVHALAMSVGASQSSPLNIRPFDTEPPAPGSRVPTVYGSMDYRTPLRRIA